MPQIGSEKRLSQAASSVGEPGLLGTGLDSVANVEAKTDETGDDGVLDELGGNLGGRLNGLSLDAEAANADNVSVDIAAGAALVTVGDGPGGAGQLLGSGRLGRAVGNVSGGGRLGGLGAEDPQVGRTGVKVQGEDLSGSTNGDVGDVLVIGAVAGVGVGRASLALGEGVLGSHGSAEVVADGSAVLSLGLVESGRTVGNVVLVVSDLDGSGLLSLSGESRSHAASGEEGNEESTEGLHFEG